ncbi:hypothetical protein [uncultured Draconibacterium sp.]|uniref:hypothetical protein n=1 Tax=uncultured Draconibacterium sp. TaxID=1573823 RepID=UPI00325FE425
MKNRFKNLMFLAVLAIAFAACDDSSNPVPAPVEPAVSYIVNYGGYTNDKSTITSFNKETGTATNNVYELINGVPMTSNAQYALNYNGKVYLMGNNADQIFWVNDETFEQTENALTTDIVKPRFAVATGNYMYVSCWGGDVWMDASVSYIAKVNLTTHTVEKKIALPGGPEGLEIVNNKLYAALNYDDKIAVIDLGTEAHTYIQLPAGNIPSYFEKDNSNNLYVVLGVAYGDATTQTGIGYINTTTNEVEATYALDGVSSMAYVNIMEPNDDFSKLYVMTSVMDANWNVSGSIAVFDVASKSFESTNLVDGVQGINGVDFYNDRVFCFISNGATSKGKAITYQTDGRVDIEFETGIAPFMLFTVED